MSRHYACLIFLQKIQLLPFFIPFRYAISNCFSPFFWFFPCTRDGIWIYNPSLRRARPTRGKDFPWSFLPSFSQTRTRVGVRTSGNFQFHLLHSNGPHEGTPFMLFLLWGWPREDDPSSLPLSKEGLPWEKDELPFGYGNFQFQKQIWYESENWRIFNSPFALPFYNRKAKICPSILDTKVSEFIMEI